MEYRLTIWNELTPGDATEEQFPGFLAALQRVGTLQKDTNVDRRLTLHAPGRWLEWKFDSTLSTWSFQEGESCSWI